LTRVSGILPTLVLNAGVDVTAFIFDVAVLIAITKLVDPAECCSSLVFEFLHDLTFSLSSVQIRLIERGTRESHTTPEIR